MSVAKHVVAEATINCLRSFLLPRTIEHARQISPFYRHRFANTTVALGRELESLTELPLLTKADLIDNYEDICRPTGAPALVMYTSGTEGKELLVPVSPEEVAAGDNILAPVIDDFAWFNRLKPLTLSLVRVGHGAQMFTANFPTIPAHITYGHEQAISLLRRRYSFPGSENRISAIEGNLLTLRALTNMAKANGVDGRSFGLKMLFSTGWYITQTCRNLIEDYWGAPLLDRYGVTEVNGDAKQCSACNMFHFDPFVIEEVLSPDEDKPIEEGIGRIVLTGLFPFNQVAPKIRYVIGDYVEKVTSPCGNGQPGYRFLGRMKQTLLHRDSNGTHFILFPSEIADVLDEFEEVHRRPNTGFLGFTSALVGKERLSVTVTVEVEAGATPSQRIRQRLLERSYILRQALEHELVSSLDIEIVAPGSLKTIHKI